MSDNKVIKVLLAEDEAFTRAIITESLTNAGMNVKSVGSVIEALAVIDSFDPHVVLTDLDLGPGPDGADLLAKIFKERPWTGIVAMTAHASPELAVSGTGRIPESTVYIVKSEISTIQNLVTAIEDSITRSGKIQQPQKDYSEKIVISSHQAEILRMLADGKSNASIALERGITLRAAEALIQRTFVALGVKGDPDMNSRVVAVRLWQLGKVVVK
jgi:DNA-binding NarL/FixJ family response regulator